eukprot:6353161-Ditylum_brightwellii.AAC.1
MNTFELMEDGFDQTRYQFIPLIYIWYVKFDGRCRAKLVANGKVTIALPEEDIWSRMVNTELIRTAMCFDMLNNLKILAANISSAYLMANAKEL